MLKMVYILAVLIIPCQVIAQNNGEVQLDYRINLQDGTLYIAQNTENEEDASEEAKKPPPKMPPPPLPKIPVSTEKPIEGILEIGEQAPPPEIKEEDTVKEDNASRKVTVPPAVNAPVQFQKESGDSPEKPLEEAVVDIKDLKIMEELSILGVPTGGLRTMKIVNDEEFNLKAMVYGEEIGYIRILTADNEGNFHETWKSPPLNSSVRGIFVEDLEGDGEAEIVAYTADGNIFIYGYDSHDLKYRTPENTYSIINCMVIANVDNSPELELLFIAVKPGDEQSDEGQPLGSLIQFDTASQFEEWISQEKYSATDIVIGNIDNEEEDEIILNSGEILDIRFKTLKWNSDIIFGSRLYLIDLDDDGILELVTEYNQSYIRIIDIDQRREKW